MRSLAILASVVLVAFAVGCTSEITPADPPETSNGSHDAKSEPSKDVSVKVSIDAPSVVPQCYQECVSQCGNCICCVAALAKTQE